MREDAYAEHLPVRYRERSLELVGGLSWDRYVELGRTLGRVHASAGFWIGDWVLYGEAHFGEEAAQAVDELGLRPDTVRSFVWVAERIPPVRRRTALSFSAHKEVAALPPDLQESLLDRAEREGLGSRDLRHLVRERRALESGTEPVEGFLVRAPVSAVERWREKANPRSLEDVAVELLTAWADDAA